MLSTKVRLVYFYCRVFLLRHASRGAKPPAFGTRERGGPRQQEMWRGWRAGSDVEARVEEWKSWNARGWVRVRQGREEGRLVWRAIHTQRE